jgi:hypothetical protein
MNDCHFTDDDAKGVILDFFNEDAYTVEMVGPMTIERFRQEVRDMDVDSIITLIQFALDEGFKAGYSAHAHISGYYHD